MLGSSALLLVCACGDDAKPQAGVQANGNGGNNGNGATDGTGLTSDAGTDAGDAQGDAGTRGGGTACEILGEVLSFDAARANGRVFSAAIAGNTTHVAYLTATCGGTATKNNAQGLAYVSFATEGEASAPVGIANSGDCYVTRDPAIVALGSDAVSLFYTSNSAGGYELFAQDIAGGAAAIRQTTDNDNEFAGAAAMLDPEDPPMAVYANDPALQGGVMAAAVVTKQIGKVESEVFGSAAGHHATQLAISPVATQSGSIAGAVAWISDGEATRGVHLRLINEIGAGQGDIQTLGELVGASSNVALAAAPLGAAVVYTVAPDGAAHELRFRTITQMGTVGREVLLTRGNQNVRDVSIARYAQGWVVAYRQVGAGVPTMRLLFIDEQGNAAGTREVAEASVGGAGSQVFVANDGRIVLVWNDVETIQPGDADAGMSTAESFVRVRAARLTCQ